MPVYCYIIRCYDLNQPHTEWTHWSSHQESFEAYVFFSTTEETKGPMEWDNTILHLLHIVHFNISMPVFLYALHMYLKKDLERIGKEALAIVCPGLSYRDALELSNIVSINNYNASSCNKTSTSIVNDSTDRLHNMLQFHEP